MRSYTRKKVDGNQQEIVDELRQCGMSVLTGHDDLLVGYAGITLLVEVKNKKGRNRLQESQKKLLLEWRGSYLVATDSDQVRRWFTQSIRGLEGDIH